MDNTIYLYFIFQIIYSICVVVSIIYLGIRIIGELSKRRKIQELAVYGDMLRNSSYVLELLDGFIMDRLEEYKLFRPDIFEKTMTDNIQTKLTKDLTIDVIENLSPILYNQLSLIINPEKERIYKLINTRVMMAILTLYLGKEED